jgi:hypothetical protein
VSRQDLNGHVAFEPGISRAIDLTHPSGTEQVVDSIRSDQRTWFEWCCGEAHRGLAKCAGAVVRGDQDSTSLQCRISGTLLA